MSKKTLKGLHEDVESALAEGVRNREAFNAAVKAYFELKFAVDSVQLTLRNCAKDSAQLAELMARYAERHASVFDGAEDGRLQEIRGGVFAGDITVDGEKYHLASSRTDVRRDDGNNMTQEFLNALPTEWTKAKLELVKSVVTKEDDESLAKHGLVAVTKYTWSKPE